MTVQIDLNAERGVAIGAQVGYRDLGGFGRRFIDMVPDELTQDVLHQIGALEAFADRNYTPEGTWVSHHDPYAVLHDPEVIGQRCVGIATTGRLTCVDGGGIAVRAFTDEGRPR